MFLDLFHFSPFLCFQKTKNIEIHGKKERENIQDNNKKQAAAFNFGIRILKKDKLLNSSCFSNITC